MAKHCTNCGHELQEGAKFCAECGTPAGGVSSREERQGYWEYMEATESLGGVEYRYTPYVGSTSLWSEPGVVKAVNDGVQRLLQRITPDGWEPVEPIDVVRLGKANRITFTSRKTFWMAHYYARLQELHLNCRQWHT